MNDERYCSYFTRHMPVDLRARLKFLVMHHNSTHHTKITLEELITEALELGTDVLEQAPRGRMVECPPWAK